MYSKAFPYSHIPSEVQWVLVVDMLDEKVYQYKYTCRLGDVLLYGVGASMLLTSELMSPVCK